MAGVPKVTVSGNHRVLVENYRELTKYSRELIEINGGRTVVRIHGENMEITAMRRVDIMITGQIFSAEFE